MSSILELKLLCVFAELFAVWMVISTLKQGTISVNGLFTISKASRPVLFYAVSIAGFIAISIALYSLVI